MIKTNRCQLLQCSIPIQGSNKFYQINPLQVVVLTELWCHKPEYCPCFTPKQFHDFLLPVVFNGNVYWAASVVVGAEGNNKICV